MLGWHSKRTLFRQALAGLVLLLLLQAGAALSLPARAQGVSTPTITALSPSVAPQYMEYVDLTVTGTGFLDGAIVYWNSTAIDPTSYVSDTQVTAQLPNAALQQMGTIQITVSNPDGGTSSPADFTIGNPVPVLSGVTPADIDEGTGDFTLLFNGSYFLSDAKAWWDGEQLPVTFVNSHQLSAPISAARVAHEAVVQVSVSNPAPAGGMSESVPFYVNSLSNVWLPHSPEGGYVASIAVDPNNSAVVYAGTPSGGVFKSVDAGETWTAINTGLNLSIGAVAVSPSNSSVVMAGGSVAYLSTNGGSTWSTVTGPEQGGPADISFDPTNSNKIYMIAGGSIYRTIDAGDHWTNIAAGKIGVDACDSILTLAVDWNRPGTLYAIVEDTTDVGGSCANLGGPKTWKTTDNGAHWNEIHTGDAVVSFKEIEVDPSNSEVVYATTWEGPDRTKGGVYESLDAGATWSKLFGNEMDMFGPVLFSPSHPDYVYVGTFSAAGAGFYLSTDRAQSWNRVIAPSTIGRITLDPADPAVMYANGNGVGGLFKSIDGGHTWSLKQTGLYAQYISGLAYSPATGRLIANSSGGYFASTDNGMSWQHLDVSGNGMGLTFAVDPADPDHMFSSNVGWSGGLGGTILETTDAWQTWTAKPFPYALLTFAADGHLYAASSDNAGTGPGGKIYESSNDGDTWTDRSGDLPACIADCMPWFLVADPANPDVLYVNFSASVLLPGENVWTEYEYLYKTADGGDHWTRIDNGISTVNTWRTTFAVDPINTSILYFASSDVLKSIDGGLTWQQTAGLPVSYVKTIVVDPTNDQVIYLGKDHYGMYRSTDQGETWASFNHGMPLGDVAAILPVLSAPAAQAAPPAARFGGHQLVDVAYNSAGVLAQPQASGSRVSRVYTANSGTVYSYLVHNYAPTALTLSRTSVPGHMEIGTVVGDFTTTDENTDDDFVYQLVPGDGDTDNASFSAANGQLRTGEVFDYSVKTSYSVRVRSTDIGGLSTEMPFTITITPNMAAPLLESPARGQKLLCNRPLFDWQDLEGASGYSIQICRNGTCSSSLSTASPATSSFTPGTSLPASTTLYWRVRAKLGSYMGPWSAIRSFTTANPPSIPAALSPANGALTLNYQPKLDWSTAVLPAWTQFWRYEVEWARDAGFSSGVGGAIVDGLANSEYTPAAPFDPNTRYYWHVRTFNTRGEYTPWSSAWSFRTALLAPVPTEPADDAIASIHTTAATLKWTDPNTLGVTGSSIQVSRSQAFSPVLKSASTPGTSYSAVLPANSVLYWRVRANGANGPSPWSTGFALLTGNPPSVPAPLSPAAGSLTSNYSPTFSWKASTAPAGTNVDHYEIAVASDAAFTTPTSLDTAALSTNAIPLQPNKVYYWHVRAWNSAGDWSPWSAARLLKTALKAPALTSPANPSTDVPLKPAFSWTDENGLAVTGFNLQISRSPTFSSILMSGNPTTTSFTPGTNLPVGTTLYWRVRTKGANGTSAWSSVFSFATGAVP